MATIPGRIDPKLYRTLCALADRMHAERGGVDSIDPVGLLHEAWIKLERSNTSAFESQRHFFAVCARAMRQILVDRARAKNAVKRGERPLRVQIDLEQRAATECSMLAFDQAMNRLRKVDAELADVALLRALGGLTVQEIAESTGVSHRTATSRWKAAREFLAEHLLEA